MTKNYFGGLAQSEEHIVCNDEALGSKPRFSKLYYKIYNIIWNSPQRQENYEALFV